LAKVWKILALLILTLVLFAFILFGSPAPVGEFGRTDLGNLGTRHFQAAPIPVIPPKGDAMDLGFQKAFQAKFPGLPIRIPMKRRQKFLLANGCITK